MPTDAGTHPRKPSVIIFTLYFSWFFSPPVLFPFFWSFKCPANKRSRGNRVANLTNGSLRYSFESKNHIRHRQTRRHKREKVPVMYVRFIKPKIVQTNVHANLSTDARLKSFSSLSRCLLDFVTFRSDMTGSPFQQMAQTSETSNSDYPETGRCFGDGGSWESYNLWPMRAFILMIIWIATCKQSKSPTVSPPGNTLDSKQSVVSAEKYELWELTDFWQVTFLGRWNCRGEWMLEYLIH